MENIEEIGPSKISFPTFVLKLLAAGTGGAVGSLILLVIFLFSGTLFEPLTNLSNPTDYVSPIFVFILMMMIFLASTVGNILSTLLLGLTERGKYKRIPTTLYQVFIISVIIFLLMVPVYFISSAAGLGITAYAVALHIIISAQVSILILEIVSNYKYALVGVYGTAFSIILSAAVLFGLSMVVTAPAVLLFIALPVIWGSMAFTTSISTMLYGWIARTYDKDFLSTQTLYGNDYGKEVEAPEEQPVIEDSEGADFLRKEK